MGLKSRIKSAWNAFMSRDQIIDYGFSAGYSYRNDRTRLTRGNEKSIVNSVLNRMALDASQMEIKHVMTDKENRYLYTIDSSINYCMNVSANIDQTGRAFRQDVVMSMFNEGNVAMLITDASDDPSVTESYDIGSIRTGNVTNWYPEYVEVEAYNERTGNRDRTKVPKNITCIVENPLYYIMNAPSSILQRLMRKLALLDIVDDEMGSNKLNMIIQLPYVIKTEARKKQAEARRKDIEDQLSNNKLGIAYTDGTEKITQLNRPLENNLIQQVQYWYDLFLSQLGITVEILNGTADETAMNNYYNRTIEPILAAIVDEMNRKWLSQNARTRGQVIKFFRDPFKLIPINNLADLADKLIRNEILTPNEMRQLMGMKSANDPKADQLRNPNISESNEQVEADLMNQNEGMMSPEQYDPQMAEVPQNYQ